MSIQRHFVDGRYGQIHYRLVQPDSTTKPPLLCLHMSPKSGRIFHTLMSVMGSDRLLIAPDYPGYGESTAPPAQPHVAIEDYTEAVYTVCQTLGLEQVDVLGYHTGSLVAADLARQHPQQVRRLILLSAPVMSAEELSAFKRYYEPIPLDMAGTRFNTMWQRIVEYRGPGVSLELMAESFAENLRGGEAYEWGHRAAFDYMERQFEQTLSALPHRTLIYNPQDDLWQYTRRAYPLLRHSEVIEREDWGHGCLDIHTEEAGADFSRFLDTDNG